MKILEWKKGMSPEEALEVAYFERNMLALLYARGWYYDTENKWPGYRRALSLSGGKLSFHVPDSFDLGNLRRIVPDWDGHTTREKWLRIGEYRNIVWDE